MTLPYNELGNIQIKEDCVVFAINPKIYPIDVVYSAAYVMIDKAFILLDGDPSTSIKVEIRKKTDKSDLKELIILFNEELLNYSVYKIQSERNKNIREILLTRALFTNSLAEFKQENEKPENKTLPQTPSPQ